MTTSIAANAGIQQQAPVMAQAPEFRPSYNAVQLNLSSPTLNVPPAPMPQAQPMPETATRQWQA